MKPVGQQVKMIENQPIDKDAHLMKDIFQLDQKLSDMSPVAIPKGFTRDFILKGDKSILEEKILSSFNRLSSNRNSMIIEGTGHAGVGSVFNLSNANVAKLINATVIIVSCGRWASAYQINHFMQTF